MGEKKDKDEEKRRKKSAAPKVSPTAAGKALLDKLEDAGYATGYETDAGPSGGKRRPKLKKKTRPAGAGAGDAGYETDDGYISTSQTPSKSKGKSSRFFKLGNKSKTNVEVEEPASPPEPAPPVPVFLPIAARFATTLNLDGSSPSPSTVTSPVSSPPPLPSGFPIQDVGSSLLDSAMEPLDASSYSYVSSPVASSSKRGAGMHVGSDSSDHHASGASSGPSIFSKIGSSQSSPTTSSSMSHSQPNPSVPKLTGISIPLTRSPSPPEVPKLQFSQKPSPSKSGMKHVPDPLSLSVNIGLTRGGNSPTGISPTGSPFVVLTPTDPSAPLPSDTTSHVSKPKGRGFFNDLMKPSGKRQEAGSASPSNLTSKPSLPNLTAQRSLSPQPPKLFIPSRDIITPSPRSASRVGRAVDDSTLEPPVNTFSYYELPPPSPPPDSPLPKIPAGYESASNLFPEARSGDRLRAPRLASPLSSRPVSPINGGPQPRRGVESPFPVRPQITNAPGKTTGRVPGLEARANVPRYRDLYAGSPNPGLTSGPVKSAAPNSYHRSPPIPSGYASEGGGRGYGRPPPATAPASYHHDRTRSHEEQTSGTVKSRPQRFGVRFEEDEVKEKIGFDVRAATPDDDWGAGYGDYDEDDDDDDIRAVAYRFKDQLGPVGRKSEDVDEPALGRRTSFEALKDRYMNASAYGQLGSTSMPSPEERESRFYGDGSDDDDKSRYSQYPDEADRTTMYTLGTNSSGGNLSMADGRVSIMDQDKSEQSRDRFLKRIEAMFDANGRELPARERTNVIPPVPKVPQGVVAGAVRKGGWI